MTAKEYHGSRIWAEAWARELLPRVGTHTPDGRRITGYRAQGYGDVKVKRPKIWCVVEIWVYASNPSLGSFGGDVAILLEERMP